MLRPRSFILAVVCLVAAPLLPLHAESAEETVERIRGLEFSRPVLRREIPRSELRGFLQKQIDADLPYAPEQYVEILRTLHLLDDEKDPLDSLFALYEAQALAFYDPRTHTYYSMNAPEGLTGDVPAEVVEIHELMHALQDQRFGIGARLDALRLDWDAAMAYQALLEGEATLLMMAAMYGDMGLDFDTIVRDEAFMSLLSAAASETAGIPEGTPPYFVQSMTFPYVDGLRFVVNAYVKGGWKAIDALHENPPASTEEILHPELYVARQHNPQGSAGGADGGPLLMTTLGEFHWKFLLGDEAGEGWASDRVEVRSGSDDRMTVLGKSTWDSEKDATEFAAALRARLESEGVKGRVVNDGAGVRFGYGEDAAAVSAFVKGAPAKSPKTSGAGQKN